MTHTQNGKVKRLIEYIGFHMDLGTLLLQVLLNMVKMRAKKESVNAAILFSQEQQYTCSNHSVEHWHESSDNASENWYGYQLFLLSGSYSHDIKL